MNQYNLPVATQPMVPWSNLTMQYAPFVPATIRTDPVLQPLVPAISAYCCFQVQRFAQEQPQNPLRAFMYNMCAQNQWQNPECEAMIAMAVDFLWVGVVNGRYQTYEIGLQDSCDKVIELIRSAYLVKYPALEGYCDPMLLQNARSLLGVFQAAVGEIQSTKARLTQVAQQSYQQQVYTGGVPTGYGGQQVRVGGAYGGGGFNWQAAVNTQSTAMPTGGSSVFNSGQQRPTGGGQNTGSMGGASRYDQMVVNQPQFTAVAQQETQEVPVQVPAAATAAAATESPELIPISQAKWKPSEIYPHPPAYNPELHALFVKIDAEGTMVPTVLKKDDVVDFARHAVATFGNRPKNLDLSRYPDTLERLQQGVQQINNQQPEKPPEGQEPQELPFTLLIRPDRVKEHDGDKEVEVDNVLREISNEAAWLTCEVERLLSRVDGKIPDIYRVHAKIYHTIVGTQNEAAYVRGYSACETFIELREKLNASVNKVSPSLWSTVNVRMTRAINRAIKENLSIPGLSIGNFVEDIEELQKLIEQRYGEVVLGALTKHQDAVIKRTLGTFSDEEATAQTHEYLDGESEKADSPKLTYITSNVSYTLLNCWSYELNLALVPKVGSVLLEKAAPMMYQLVKGLFEASTTLAFETEHGEFDTHLIRTLDGRVLEAQRGFINDDYFVVTLVE